MGFGSLGCWFRAQPLRPRSNPPTKPLGIASALCPGRVLSWCLRPLTCMPMRMRAGDPKVRRVSRPLAKTSDVGARAFGELVRCAVGDPDAASALALAYALLPDDARAELVEAVARDAQTHGVSGSLVLASLLAVEEDARLARQIADNISAEGGKGLASSGHAKSLLAGDERRGGLVLVRSLYGAFVEVFALEWDPARGIVRADFDPLACGERVQQYTSRMPHGMSLEDVPVHHAVRMLVRVLWNHRRRFGSLPSAVRDFDRLLAVASDGALASR